MYTSSNGKESPIIHIIPLLLLTALLYVSNMSFKSRRNRSNTTHQLRLTGSLVRTSDGKRRLCLESPDSGRFILIGGAADELYDQVSIKRVTVEGRMIRSGDPAGTSSVVEVLGYREIP